MPSLDDNISEWESPEVWQRWDLGEKWSINFGTTEIMWHSYIYPRIHNFLKNKRVLEIAPGTGRVTQYLIPLAKDYVGYDISEYCVNYCRERYGDKFIINDGKSLHNTEDSSIDFIFSWDSLVHVEEEIIFAYAKEIIRCLSDSGIAFIHHSNLEKNNYSENLHWRGNVSGSKIKEYIESIGGVTLIQEFLVWDLIDGEYSDCITVFSKNKKGNFVGINNLYFNLIIQENKKVLSEYERIK